MTNEVYVSTDIEANGRSPGHHSMLSFASVAFKLDKTIISTFERNLKELSGAKPNRETMEWWQTQPKAWKACRQNQADPKEAMTNYLDWIKSLEGTPIFVAAPVSFDYRFISWYLWEFTGEDPFLNMNAPQAIDINTYYIALMNTNITQSHRLSMPRDLFDPDIPHTHRALDDAMEQAMLFCNLVQNNNDRHLT